MFDLARFRRLAAATWLENRRAWAWFVGIGVIVHFVLLMLLLLPRSGYELMTTQFQGVIYFTGLFLTAPIFGSRYFAAMSHRESALVLLMRPASALEKWLLALIVVGIGWPLAYTLAFQLCNVPGARIAAVQGAEAVANGGWLSVPDDMSVHDAFDLYLPWQQLTQARQWAALLLPLAALQGFALLGALYFGRMALLKTILVGFVVLLMLMLAAALGHNPQMVIAHWLTDERPVEAWQRVFVPAVWFAVPVLLWLGCLFALREREVA